MCGVTSHPTFVSCHSLSHALALPRKVLRRADAQMKFIEKYSMAEFHDNVSEVGCGWGALSLQLTRSKRIGSVTSYELDTQAVEFMNGHGLDARELSLEDDDSVPLGSMDLVCSSMMLEHLPDPRQVKP